MKYFSTFSGIGGFEYAIQKCSDENERKKLQGIRNTQGSTVQLYNNRDNGFTCVGYSEIDKYAIQIYEKHFNHKNYGDITKIIASELPDFDLLVGGFPCQAFSIAGKRKGFEDTRGTLFFDLARILKEKQPRYFLFENVKGLLSHNSGKTFGVIIQTITELGYDCQWQVLNSKNFGVPQNRERVFIVGHLRGECRPKVFPVGEDYRSNNEQGELCTRQQLLQGDKFQTVQEKEEKATGQSSRQIVRKEWDQSNNTDSRGGETHSFSIRRLTPTECERLQGFRDGWTKGVSDTQRYKCLGNAVTTNVVEYIISKMFS